jgi:hypothetical protein
VLQLIKRMNNEHADRKGFIIINGASLRYRCRQSYCVVSDVVVLPMTEENS